MVGEHFDGRTTLVTGGAGAVGSRLVQQLVDFGADVVVWDDFSSGHRWMLPDSVETIDGDVSDEEDCRRAMAEDPSIVFHLAAFFANQNSIEHPLSDLETNGRGTLRVLKHCEEAGYVDRIVYASSSCVYDESMSLPLEESERVALTKDTPYEITKTIGEAYCNYFADQRGLSIARARIFNSYGPGEVPGKYRNVIPNFVFRAKKGEPLPITGSGEETRDFTFVSDIVDGLLRLGSHPAAEGEVFNLGRGKETPITALARKVNEIVGNEAGIEYKKRRDWDSTDRRCASIEKAKNAVGYQPTVDLELGLRRTEAWFEENWDRIIAAADF